MADSCGIILRMRYLHRVLIVSAIAMLWLAAMALSASAQESGHAADAAPSGGGYVAVSQVQVSNTRVNGEAALHVVANVTLRHLEDVPFTFQAVLATPDGKIHTSLRGQPYEATRDVMTGDDDDTDNYGVDLSLKDLFSSSPPADVGVQVRILDQEGRIVAKSRLIPFKRP